MRVLTEAVAREGNSANLPGKKVNVLAETVEGANRTHADGPPDPGLDNSLIYSTHSKAPVK